MKKIQAIFAAFLAFATVARVGLCAQKAPTPFSTYGQIQNVQNYSTNPYWTKDGPYNLRVPTPIYATGADLSTGDCNRVVANLIASFCASTNCATKKLSDVRPTIMVQLSQLPGHNFATSCGGYIDSEFENYKKTYGNVSTNNAVNTVTKPGTTTKTVLTGNLFAKAPSKYEQEVAERTEELKQLQSITTPTPQVRAATFPKTIDDLSFSERVENTAKGYEPYQKLASYKKPKFLEEDEEFFTRLKAVNFKEFCKRRPDDPACRPPEKKEDKKDDQKDDKKDDKKDEDDDENKKDPCEETPGIAPECPIILYLKAN